MPMHLVLEVLLLLQIYASKGDIFYFTNSLTDLRCILPKNYQNGVTNGTRLYAYRITEVSNDCCGVTSFTAIGANVFMDLDTNLCIEHPFDNEVWDNSYLELGSGCTGGFILTGTSLLQGFRKEYCVTYDDNFDIIFRKCDQVTNFIRQMKCGTIPTAEPPTTTPVPPTTSRTTTPLRTTTSLPTSTTTEPPTTTLTTTTTTERTTTTTERTTTAGPTTTPSSWWTWNSWSNCSTTCGDGIQRRERDCRNPSICGSSEEEQEQHCFIKECSGVKLAKPGESCTSMCERIGYFCTPILSTGNTAAIFEDMFNLHCSSDQSQQLWKQDWHPSFHVSTGLCAGYVFISESYRPETFKCTIEDNSNYDTIKNDVRRACMCLTADDIGYTNWTPWDQCTKSCGGGRQRRTRRCFQASCSGPNEEFNICNKDHCPIHGQYSEWSLWTNCSKPCDGGESERTRICNNPAPQHNGRKCFGGNNEIEACNVQFCEIDGMWTDWSPFDICNSPCGGGRRIRYRFCEEPMPLYGGDACRGGQTEGYSCHLHTCPGIPTKITACFRDEPYLRAYSNKLSKEFIAFHERIELNVNGVFRLTTFEQLSLDVNLQHVEESTLPSRSVATFSVHFQFINSTQLALLQDVIEISGAIDKMVLCEDEKYKIASNDIPPAPTYIVATGRSYSQISVHWDEVGNSSTYGTILGYIVFYRLTSHPEDEFGIKPAHDTSVVLIGLEAMTKYSMRVAAYTINGIGVASEETFAFTLPTTPQASPLYLEPSVTSSFNIFLQWGQVELGKMGGVPLGYFVEWNSTKPVFSNSTIVNYTTRHVLVSGLEPATSYIVTVCPTSTFGRGPCARNKTRTLPSAPSEAPADVQSSCPDYPNSILLNWTEIREVHHHGDLRGYAITLSLQRLGSTEINPPVVSVRKVHPKSSKALIEQLHFGASYSVTVHGYNDVGAGVASEPLLVETCRCPEILYANYALLKPYIYRNSSGDLVGVFPSILEKVVDGACQVCCLKNRDYHTIVDMTKTGKSSWSEKSSFTNMLADIDNYTTMSFPILAKSDVTAYIGGSFVPFVEHPGSILIVRKISVADQVATAGASILSIWPLLLILILLLFVAGILVWAMERNFNEEIRNSFINGVSDGIWLAFITMATVGYGDKTLLSTFGRMFTFLWTFTSMVITALLVGTISTSLISATELKNDIILYGTSIAAVEGTNEYRIGVVRNAKVNNVNNYTSLAEIERALDKREVEGLLVDAFSAGSTRDFSQSYMEAKKVLYYTSSYGLVLMGDMYNARDFFDSYISGNQIEILRLIAENAKRMVVTIQIPKAISLFSPESESVITSLWALTVAVFISSVIGFTIWYFCIKETNPSKQMYDCIVAEQRDLLDAVREFKEQFEEDNDVLETRQIYDRARLITKPPLTWKTQHESIAKRLMMQEEYHKTYDNRYISVNDINMIYLK